MEQRNDDKATTIVVGDLFEKAEKNRHSRVHLIFVELFEHQQTGHVPVIIPVRRASE